jgi:cytochrome c-type biogenesis protein
MFENIFLTVNSWLAGGTFIAALGAFFWGMISVLFSPCYLASFPLIVAYVGGQEVVQSRKAGFYSLAFTSGLFITIALIGVICALLGRMLGDIGSYWQIPVGGILIWVALGMLGVEKCSMTGNSFLARLNLKGVKGALVLGLAYGVLSGSCTFGFLAPLLAIITIQKMVINGIILILLFALGQSLPIYVAASSTAAIRKLIENQSWQTGGHWFRRGAGVLIGLLGLYFIINPFLSS